MSIHILAVAMPVNAWQGCNINNGKKISKSKLQKEDHECGVEGYKKEDARIFCTNSLCGESPVGSRANVNALHISGCAWVSDLAIFCNALTDEG